MSSPSSSRNKHRRGSHSSSKPGWTDWGWDEQRQKEYRARKRTDGSYDYEYRDKLTPAGTASGSNLGPTSGGQPYSEAGSGSYGTQIDNSSSQRQNDLSSAFSSLNLDSNLQDDGGDPPASWIRTRKPERETEKLDHRFRVQSEKEFRFARIFKILWSEPQGAGGTQLSSVAGIYSGQNSQQKIRRFVIVRQRRGHCVCLPIMTYQGQGTKKHGVHAEDHAIIHTTNEPVWLPGENGMDKAPIRAIPHSTEHHLDKASRLNYTKSYTVEYNVKVFFIGKIHKDSERNLITAFNAEHGPLGNSHGAPAGQLGGNYEYSPGPSNSGWRPQASNFNLNSHPRDALSYGSSYNPTLASPQSFATSSSTYPFAPGNNMAIYDLQQPGSASNYSINTSQQHYQQPTHQWPNPPHEYHSPEPINEEPNQQDPNAPNYGGYYNQ